MSMAHVRSIPSSVYFIKMWITVLLLIFTNVYGKEHVPVVIWGDYDSSTVAPKPALSQVKALQFGQLLHQITSHKPHILLFTEHTLSVEDLSWNENSNRFAYSNLKNLSVTSPGFLYLPSVEAPVSVLHQLTHHGYSFGIYEERAPPPLQAPTIITARLREPGAAESRPTFLAAHDAEMAHITQSVQKQYGNVLVLYTGRHASFIPTNKRHKREVEIEETALGEIFMSDSEKKIVVATGSPIIYRKGKEVIHLTQVIYASIDTNKNYFALDVKFKEEAISLDLLFSSPTTRSSWTLETIKVEHAGVELKSRQAIGGPPGYSYFCAKNITFTGTGQDGVEYSLTLQGIQAQPRVKNNAFGTAIDCVPYFSEPILSALFVLSLLMAVLTIAILFILDIRTMDKFDDTKGKAITISNAE